MLEPVRHPWPVRALNAAGAAARAAGLRPVSLDPDALKSRAVRRTGLGDFGEPDFEEGLATLCDSAEADAGLHLAGRLAVRDHIATSLVTRLRRVEARKRDPVLFRRPLAPPLIVVGLHRSGTTYLHRLLAQASDARPLLFYEVMMPLAGPGPDRRREEAAAFLARSKRAAPALEVKHPLGVDEPEECMFLLDNTFCSMGFWWLAPVYRYLDWVLEQDPRPPYRVYREHLQLFQAESPERRLVLKAPVHAGNLAALLEAVPEARIVQTHREPVTAIASANSLLHTLHGLVTDRSDPRRMATANTEALARLVDRNLADRERIGGDRIFDVSYDALVADPLGTVRDVHRHFDLPFDGAFEARLKLRIQEAERGRPRGHVYHPGEFGLDERVLRERFRAYRRRFLEDPSGARKEGEP